MIDKVLHNGKIIPKKFLRGTDQAAAAAAMYQQAARLGGGDG